MLESLLPPRSPSADVFTQQIDLQTIYLKIALSSTQGKPLESITNPQSIRFNSIPKSYFPSLSTVPYETEQFDGLFDISL